MIGLKLISVALTDSIVLLLVKHQYAGGVAAPPQRG
jgi:hypothetical protein